MYFNKTFNYPIKISFTLVFLVLVYCVISNLRIFFLLFDNYEIGMSWDWGVPNSQFTLDQFIDQLSPINREFINGKIIGYNFEIFYWAILTIFSLIFGKLYIFVFLVLCKFINIIFLLKLIDRKNLNFTAILLILLYSENFLFQTRILAGHLPFYLFYCLTPLIIFYIINLKKDNFSHMLLPIFSIFYFVNITAIVTYFILLLSLYFFNKKNIELYKLFFIALFSIILSLNTFSFLFISILNPEEFLGSHQINSLSESFKERFVSQTEPKSLNIFVFPFLNYAKSFFYELLNNRPLILNLFDSFFTLILCFLSTLILYLKFLKINKPSYVVVLLISLFLCFGVNNIFIYLASLIDLSLIQSILIFYSNPLRFAFLIFLSLNLIVMNNLEIIKIKPIYNYILILFLISVVLADNLYNYKNNYHPNEKRNTQINAIEYLKPINNEFINQLLNNPDDDFNFIMLPSPRNGWFLNPTTSFPWSTNFYKNSIFYSQVDNLKAIEFENNIYAKKQIQDEFLNFFFDNSIRYLIIPKADKYFVYKNSSISLDYENLNNLNQEVFEVTHIINNLKNKFNEFIIHDDHNFLVFEFNYKSRISANVENKGKNIPIKFKTILNGLYFFYDIDKKVSEINLSDIYFGSYKIILLNKNKILTTLFDKNNIFGSYNKNNQNYFRIEKDLNFNHLVFVFNLYVFIYLLNFIISIIFFCYLISKLLKIYKLKNA